MTQEEKAKAYDEALALMKDCIPDKDGYVCVRPCDIFSELAESEDERIRKAQLDYWRSVGGKEWHGVPVQEVIAWLEKQAPKSKWTEEDDKRQISIIEYLNELYDDNRFSLDELTDMETWLNSLKQRIEE